MKYSQHMILVTFLNMPKKINTPISYSNHRFPSIGRLRKFSKNYPIPLPTYAVYVCRTTYLANILLQYQTNTSE